jgi:hypothetical protein
VVSTGLIWTEIAYLSKLGHFALLLSIIEGY